MPDLLSLAKPPSVFVDNDYWQLEIALICPAYAVRARAEIKLDSSMRAVPPQRGSGLTEWTVGLQGVQPTVGVKFTTGGSRVEVAPDQRTVSISLPFGAKRVEHVIRVPFRFLGTILPRRIAIEVTGRSVGSPPARTSYEGVYLGSASSVAGNLVDFLKDSRNRFFFGRQGVAPQVLYESLSKVIPAAQRLSGAIVWGTTWPHELDFWNSPSGVDFLAFQIVDLAAGRGIPRRIAICPFALEVEQVMAQRFIAELEVQYSLGVDVRILEPARMVDDLDGVAEALLCLGDRLGVLYSGILAPGGKGTTAQLLFGDEIETARALYDASQLSGRPFAEYLLSYPRPQTLNSYVRRRIRIVRARVDELRPVNSFAPERTRSPEKSDHEHALPPR
jgi:hypothetical protein